MNTVLIIGIAAIVYVVLLAGVLMFFAGAARANERWDRAAEQALQADWDDYDRIRRAA